MSRVSDSKLRAYLDGEADDIVTKEVERALETNPDVQATAALMRRSKDVLSRVLADEFTPPKDLVEKLRSMAEADSEDANPPPAVESDKPPAPADSAQRYKGMMGVLQAANTNKFRGLFAIAACLGLFVVVSEDVFRNSSQNEFGRAAISESRLRSAGIVEQHHREIDFSSIVPKEIGTLRGLIYAAGNPKTGGIEIKEYGPGKVLNLKFGDELAFYFESKTTSAVSLILKIKDGPEIQLIEASDTAAGEGLSAVERIVSSPPANSEAGIIILNIVANNSKTTSRKIPIATIPPG